ncbi:histone-lysine N-methyltransferase SETDB1-A isoform X2 [Sphaeramia orbicularis]|uniref:histone-lysine N-methyltransferase SETDB1-A isoform X2 n=1 Tax=Sphaeramia orbicularis TaxID=375764 RepID=UPI00117C2097|nr:histone-lysine N-methyltransferase SETDB1-A-like isoform X2 [Sphaeramia orbicularis]
MVQKNEAASLIFCMTMEGDEMEMTREELQRLISEQINDSDLVSQDLLNKYHLLQTLLAKKEKQAASILKLCESVAKYEAIVKKQYAMLGWDYRDTDSEEDEDITDNGNAPESSCENLNEDQSEKQIHYVKRPVVVLMRLPEHKIRILCGLSPEKTKSEDELSSISCDSDRVWEPEEQDLSDADFSDAVSENFALHYSSSDSENGGTKRKKSYKMKRKGAKTIAAASPMPSERSSTPPTRSSTPSEKSSVQPTRSPTPPTRSSTPSAKSSVPAARAPTPPTGSSMLSAKSSAPSTKSTPSAKSSAPPTKSSTPSAKSSAPPTKSSTLSAKSSAPPTKSSTLSAKSSAPPTKSSTLSAKSSAPPTKSSTLSAKSSAPPTKSTPSAKVKSSAPPTKSSTLSAKSSVPPTKSSAPSAKSSAPPTTSSTPTAESSTPVTETSTQKASSKPNIPEGRKTLNVPSGNKKSAPSHDRPAKAPAVLPEVTEGMSVVARKKAMRWYRGKITEIIKKESGSVKYKVVFENDLGKVLVSGHHIAFDLMNRLDQLQDLSRVLVRHPEEPWFCPGVLAERPGRRNRMRFLVFLDDHTPIYVSLPLIRLVCKPLPNPWDDIPEGMHRNFIEQHTKWLPNPPLTQCVMGQTMKAMFKDALQKCSVLQIDFNLIEVLFTEDQHKEWIYRGSPRLEHIINMTKYLESNDSKTSQKK